MKLLQLLVGCVSNAGPRAVSHRQAFLVSRGKEHEGDELHWIREPIHALAELHQRVDTAGRRFLLASILASVDPFGLGGQAWSGSIGKANAPRWDCVPSAEALGEALASQRKLSS